MVWGPRAGISGISWDEHLVAKQTKYSNFEDQSQVGMPGVASSLG